MYVQYINRGPHTVIDGKNEYTFKYMEVKEIPDNIGRFITSKMRHSFRKIEQDQSIIKDSVTEKLKLIHNHIIIHVKKKDERYFKCTLSPAAA